MFFEVNKRSGDLNEALVKGTIRIPTFEPEMLQHIMSLVVFPLVEAFEKTGIAGVVTTASGRFQSFNKCGNALALLHQRSSSSREAVWESIRPVGANPCSRCQSSNALTRLMLGIPLCGPA